MHSPVKCVLLTGMALLCSGGCNSSTSTSKPANRKNASSTPTSSKIVTQVVTIKPSSAKIDAETSIHDGSGIATLVADTRPRDFLFRQNNLRWIGLKGDRPMMVDEAKLPNAMFTFSCRFDESMTAQDRFDAIVRAFEAQFSVTIKIQKRVVECFSLISTKNEHPGLEPTKQKSPFPVVGTDYMQFSHVSMAELGWRIQDDFGVPVVDKSRLPGYFNFVLDVPIDRSRDRELVIAELEKHGLSLVLERQPVDLLVISKQVKTTPLSVLGTGKENGKGK